MQIFLIVLLILAIIIVTRIRIVQQARAYVIERLGAYKTTWGVGIHFLVPCQGRLPEGTGGRLPAAAGHYQG